MQSVTRGIFFILAFILFIFGVIDVAEQFKAGEEVRWRVPIIFLGFGAGIPLVLFSFPEMFSTESDAYADKESGECSSDNCSGDGDSD
ncbi:hypothetical protein ACJJI5_03965 [Microbulbifer sp. EKSA008]|uniref:hypothetical protein n=1 Tax=unclassified Microbulbifer TaxID=2619833 RepID=UPI004041DD55